MRIFLQSAALGLLAGAFTTAAIEAIAYWQTVLP